MKTMKNESIPIFDVYSLMPNAYNSFDIKNVLLMYHVPYSIQSGQEFPTKHQPDDNMVERFVRMRHECFYQKMRRHVMIFQLRVFDKNRSYN